MELGTLQRKICRVITGIGGKIKWKKELGVPAKLYYFFSRKEPVINIEALLLGERFAVVINNHQQHKLPIIRRFNSSGYRIIVCNSLEDFKMQFEEFKNEKLRER